MKELVRNQHYVPQFYLRKFGSGKKTKRKVWVFNKKTLALKEEFVKNIASSDYFYDIEEEFVLEGYSEDKRQLFEEFFGNLETKVSNSFDKLINKVEDIYEKSAIFDIEYEDRMNLSHFITFQFFRTNSFREKISSFQEDVLVDISKILKKEPILLNESQKKLLHLEFFKAYFESDMLIHKSIYNRTWIILKNNTNLKICTSDNPVYLEQFRDLGPYGYSILTADLIVFPLTPKYILCMYRQDTVPQVPKQDEKEIFLGTENSREKIESINLRITYEAHNEIYSIDNNFNTIYKACKKNEYNITLSPSERER